jgi:hypothetical protein
MSTDIQLRLNAKRLAALDAGLMPAHNPQVGRHRLNEDLQTRVIGPESVTRALTPPESSVESSPECSRSMVLAKIRANLGGRFRR